MPGSLIARGPWARFHDALRDGGSVLIGLDLDGTLAPIVDHPSRARVRPGVLRLLERCARAHRTRVAIVSARPLSAMRRLLPIAGLHRVGRYGLEGFLAPPADRRAVLRRATARLARETADLLRAVARIRAAAPTPRR